MPDFYRSCDILEFFEAPVTEGILLATLFEKHDVRYLFRGPSAFDTIDTMFAEFTDAVRLRNTRARINGEPLYSPDLHISCHGCPEGVGWKDSELVSWSKLGELLWSFASGIGYVGSPTTNGAFAQETSLIGLSLSCCHGTSASEVLLAREPYPVCGLLAPDDEIYMDSCAQFFLRLHTRLFADPWNLPAKVAEIQEAFSPQGPSGSVSFLCFNPPFTPNPAYVPPRAADA